MRFDDNVTIRYQTEWSERDYREARRGHWMHYAADQARFNRRVYTFEHNFAYIFTDIHRDYICSLIRQFNIDDLTNVISMLSISK